MSTFEEEFEVVGVIVLVVVFSERHRVVDDEVLGLPELIRLSVNAPEGEQIL